MVLNFIPLQMDKKLNGKFEKLLEKIEDLVSSKVIPEKYPQIFREFLNSYQEVIIEHGEDPENYIGIFDTFIELVKEGFKKPFTFEPYHEKIRAPFDYYKFGIDFLRPLVDLPNSTVSGAINLEYMESFLKKKENVILLPTIKSKPILKPLVSSLRKCTPNLLKNSSLLQEPVLPLIL